MRCLVLLAFAVLFGCSEGGAPPQQFMRDARGTHPVGTRTLMLEDTTRQRVLPVEIWYPAAESARATETLGEPIAAMVVGEEDRTRYEALLDAAPAECPTKHVRSAREAKPAEGKWPLVMVSHCHNCTRFAYASIAEHLASYGVAVAVTDHVGNTLFDALDEEALPLNTSTLAIRVGDLRFVLDTLLDEQAESVDASLRGKFDANRLGAMGHSFGSVTAGVFTKEEPRVKALIGLAAPIENALLPGVTMTEITKPVMLFVAKEDNSITEFGNDMIRENYANANPPVWKLELEDAGHWSFTDIAGAHSSFMAGCGTGERQTKAGQQFTYPKVQDQIALVRSWVAAMFLAHLNDDAMAKLQLASNTEQDGVEVKQRK